MGIVGRLRKVKVEDLFRVLFQRGLKDITHGTESSRDNIVKELIIRTEMTGKFR